MLETQDTSISHILQNEPELDTRYRHYKGKEYKVLAIGMHTESLEKYVVYQALYYDAQFGNFAIWIRPLAMFMGTVELEGHVVQRFSKVS